MGLIRTWWNGIEVVEEPVEKLRDGTIRSVKWVLRISLGLLLVGHGGLAAIAQRPYFIDHLQAVGIPATQSLVTAMGWFEIALGFAVALRPVAPLVWFTLFWKLATESLWPIAGRTVDIFETIERWGDYGGCVALLLILYYERLSGGPNPSRLPSAIPYYRAHERHGPRPENQGGTSHVCRTSDRDHRFVHQEL
jgi:hypothetical protein